MPAFAGERCSWRGLLAKAAPYPCSSLVASAEGRNALADVHHMNGEAGTGLIGRQLTGLNQEASPVSSKAPPIPPEQRSSSADKANIKGSDIGRRDRVTGDQSSDPGDGDVNLEQQGRQGNIHQNTRHQGYQQDR
jgi:hypothetical protein